MTRVNPVNFNDAWEKRTYFEVKDFKVPVVDYEHLILTKISTAKPKDNLDLIELPKINQFRENK